MTGLGLTRVQPFRDRDFHLDPIDLALALFKGINRTCRAAGAKLVVMKFGAFLHQTGKDKLRDFVLTDQATRLEAGITKQVQGAHYLDLDAAFKRKGLTASTLTLPEDAYHWNHKGHIASAHILAEFLGARGLLMEAP